MLIPQARRLGELPGRVFLEGRRVTIVPLDPIQHAEALYIATAGKSNDDLWTYLFDGPFVEREEFGAYLQAKASTVDPLFFSILDKSSTRAVGHAAYMRIEPKHLVIEVGSILYAPSLQRTPAATEAMYLMAKYVFEDLKYRRYEWKCNTLNQSSRSAASRLGFTFEGVFRQHMLVKGKNRDTAWYSMLDTEWPRSKAAFEAWLTAANFDQQGNQRRTLSDIRREM